MFERVAKRLIPIVLPLALLATPQALAFPSLTLSRSADRELLQRTSAAFNDVARKVTPAVVSITALKRRGPRPGDPLAEVPGMPGQDSPGMGIGSGVVIRADGIVVTNNHVVEDAERVTVALDDKHKWKAKVLGTDPRTDIAVLKIDEKIDPLPVVAFGNSDQIQVGDWAVAIGAPFGLTHSVTSGIISAKGRSALGAFDTEDFIQTDAAINPGNSGGPLLNLNGEIIGINAAIYSQSGGFIGIGFSIPSNLAKTVSDEILKNGRVIRGWIGVVAQDMDADLARHFKSPNQTGALISNIADGGPASRSDLKVGDVVVKYDHRAVKDSSELKSLVAHTAASSKVPLEVLRKGKTAEVSVTVLEAPRPAAPRTEMAGQAADRAGGQPPSLGLSVQDIPDEIRVAAKLKSREGVLVVAVRPGSPAFDAGLAPGDVILQANEAVVRNAEQFVSTASRRKPEETLVLYVQRGPVEKIFVPLKPVA
jgi:serine protease Do